MKIKRILSVLLTLVIVAGLSGCGNKSKKDNNSSVSKDNQSSDNKNDVKKVNEKKHYPVELKTLIKRQCQRGQGNYTHLAWRRPESGSTCAR